MAFKLLARIGCDVVVRKINVRFDMRKGVQQIIAQLVDALAEFAGELFVGDVEREFRARMDHVQHRLGLCQIKPPVEETRVW